MATKTISVTDDAYQLLRERKLANESFSEEIRRLLSKRAAKTLHDFVGILSDEEGKNMLKDMEKIRAQQAKIAGQRARWT
jgi:predicted CopG family antitoxin